MEAREASRMKRSILVCLSALVNQERTSRVVWDDCLLVLIMKQGPGEVSWAPLSTNLRMSAMKHLHTHGIKSWLYRDLTLWPSLWFRVLIPKTGKTIAEPGHQERRITLKDYHSPWHRVSTKLFLFLSVHSADVYWDHAWLSYSLTLTLNVRGI